MKIIKALLKKGTDENGEPCLQPVNMVSKNLNICGTTLGSIAKVKPNERILLEEFIVEDTHVKLKFSKCDAEDLIKI